MAAADEVSRRIDRADAMREPGDGDGTRYLAVGRSALDAIAGILARLKRPAPRRILDLGCGHGRVLRWLRAAWPDAALTACDRDEAGIAFCARTFGADPVPAPADPATLAFAEPFDLVWIGSVLTHLDAAGWRALLAAGGRALARGGVLALTAHGGSCAARLELGIEVYGITAAPDRNETFVRFAREGFAYRDYPGHAGYGIAFADPAWVAAQAAAVGLRVAWAGECAWDDHQDVYALVQA